MILEGALLGGLLAIFLWMPDAGPGLLKPLGQAVLFGFVLIVLGATASGSDRNAGLGRGAAAAWGLGAVFLMLAGLSAILGVDAYAGVETLLGYLGLFVLAGSLAMAAIRAFEPLWSVIAAGLAATYAWGRLEGIPSAAFAGLMLISIPIFHRKVREDANPWPAAVILSGVTACLIAARDLAALGLFLAYLAVEVLRSRETRIWSVAMVLATAGLIIHQLGPSSLFGGGETGRAIDAIRGGWSAALSEFRDFPVWGVGPGNFARLAGQYSATADVPLSAQGAHMSVLAETGIAGACAALALTAIFLRWLLQARPRYAGSLALLGSYSLLGDAANLPALGLIFFLLIGLSAPADFTAGKPLRIALAGAALFGFAVSLVFLTAGVYHRKGMEILDRLPAARAELYTAALYFEKARRFWPSAEEDAALGRVWMRLSEDAGSDREESVLRAVKHFREAVRKSPETLAHRLALGGSLLSAGDRRNAAEEFRQAARLDPRGPHVETYLQILATRPNA